VTLEKCECGARVRLVRGLHGVFVRCDPAWQVRYDHSGVHRLWTIHECSTFTYSHTHADVPLGRVDVRGRYGHGRTSR